MKKSLFFILAFLPACTHVPFSPRAKCRPQTTSLPRFADNTGLSADKTVQFMLQAPTLINSKPADPEEWPASVYARMKDSACSATLVGERVLLIASHCVPNGGLVSFSAHANNYTARCTNHPEYASNITADWTLCLVNRPVTGVLFESLGTDEKLAIGEAVTLSGYGCTQSTGVGGNDGIFRIGTAKIEGLPTSADYDVVTRGGAALCFGDSGGSAYVVKNDRRVIFGVNSRGDIHTTSYLTSVAAKSFVDWARNWARHSNNVKICGLHADALFCRNDVLTAVSHPEPVDSFVVESDAACIQGFINPAFRYQRDEITKSVQTALDKYEDQK